MKKIVFVVHRYAPFPGGSEYNCQQMAEECVRRNLDVTVIAGEHKGDLNGVHVTSDANHLFNKDLVIIHGGDVGVQNFVLSNAKEINSPILYLLIKPSESPVCLAGLNDCDFIGCSTIEDFEHVKKWKVEHKTRKVDYGINLNNCVGTKGLFKKKYNIPENKRMFLSCGGYWPNKKMKELAQVFHELNLNDSILVMTGYDNRHNLMPAAAENILPLMVEDPKDVKNAIADADCYIMNSNEEGFGLVILEAMINKTPWLARNIAGAKMLSRFGQVYETEEELKNLISKFSKNDSQIESAHEYTVQNHLIKNTIDDIIKVLNELEN